MSSLLSGLAGAWCPSAGAYGYKLLDITTGNRHGNLTNMDAGSDWAVASYKGQSFLALDYDGTDDRVVIPNVPPAYQTGMSGPFSGSSWVMFRSFTNFPTVFGRYQSNAGTKQFLVYPNASNISVCVIYGPSGYLQSLGATLSLNTWYHLAFSYNGGTPTSSLSSYVNGVKYGATSSGVFTGMNTSTRDITIGDIESPFYPLNGMIGDVALWNRPLSDGEVVQLFNLGPTGLPEIIKGQIPRRRYALAPPVAINPNLLTNTSTFYNATVSAGSVNINANLLTNSSVFYNATITGGISPISPNLLVNSSILYNPTITQVGLTQPDTSDILTGRKKKKKSYQDILDEENVAAQILKARQGKPVKYQEQPKQLQLNLRQRLEDGESSTQVTQSLIEDVVLSAEAKNEIKQIVEEFQKKVLKQKQLKQLHLLMLFATMED